MKKGQYVITSTTGDSIWHETSAKTLRGAKRAASMMYADSFNGRIEVGYCMDNTSVDTVAVKRGYDGWSE